MNIFLIVSLLVLTLVNAHNCFQEVELNIHPSEQITSFQNLNSQVVLEESSLSHLAPNFRQQSIKSNTSFQEKAKRFSPLFTGESYTVKAVNFLSHLNVPTLIFPFHSFW